MRSVSEKLAKKYSTIFILRFLIELQIPYGCFGGVYHSEGEGSRIFAVAVIFDGEKLAKKISS